ncbi:hypothetical protein [Trinickia dinghuensis]|nr:hypothetical protein [Trinickia dinghuensis]
MRWKFSASKPVADILRSHTDEEIYMKKRNRRLLASMLMPIGLGVSAKPTLSCDADKSSISHSLEITEKNNGVPDFSYMSSTPSQSLALNCTIDSSLVSGAPTFSGNMITYTLSGGDSLSITKQSHGYLFDMSRLNSANYCSGVVAKKLMISFGKVKCKIE